MIFLLILCLIFSIFCLFLQFGVANFEICVKNNKGGLLLPPRGTAGNN